MNRLVKSFIILMILLLAFAGFYFAFLTGKVTSEEATHSIGPSQTEIQCMSNCMGCNSPGIDCTGNQQECQTECNLEKPEQTVEEICVETCTKKGCGEFDFLCQSKNQAVCDKECGMIKEPEAKSEEEQCIRDCVKKEDSNLICNPGEGGEKGNELCKRCASSCEYLYAGPCLTEMKLEEAKKVCDTCEHCYGKPVMGDSGEGYDCIVSIECADASAEFGDDPGTGEGILTKAGEVAGNILESIGNFFENIFGENEENSNEPVVSSE